MGFIASDPTDLKLSYLVLQQTLHTALDVTSMILIAADFFSQPVFRGDFDSTPSRVSAFVSKAVASRTKDYR